MTTTKTEEARRLAADIDNEMNVRRMTALAHEAARQLCTLADEVDRLTTENEAQDWEPLPSTEREELTARAAFFEEAFGSAVEEQSRLRTENEALRARKDGAYLERNQVVAALSKCFPSVRTRTAIEGWSEDWHGCVYIELPTGQVSWHFHDSQEYLFDHLPQQRIEWDGHDTPEKYRRLAAIDATMKVKL